MGKAGSEHLVEALEKAGVKRVYGVVGDSLNGLTEALRRKSMDWVHLRHEDVAAFAAGLNGDFENDDITSHVSLPAPYRASLLAT